MSSRRLTRWYPKVWRDEYGDEFSLLLDEVPMTWRVVADVGWHAAGAHVRCHGRILKPAAALLLWVCAEVVSVRMGVTSNVAWAPTDLRRAAMLVVTFAPLAAIAAPVLTAKLASAGARYRRSSGLGVGVVHGSGGIR